MQSKQIHFLLVEDDDDHAALVERTLRHNHVVNSLDRVSDGAEALAYLRREDQFADHPDPDAVLLDLKLPKVNGHEVLEWIKQDRDLCTTPVIIITTSDAEVDRDRAYRNHANSYLVKPIDFDQFRQMVHDLKRYWGFWNESPPHTPQGQP